MYIHTREQIENVVVNEWGLKKSNIKIFGIQMFLNPIDLVFKPYVLNPQYVRTENKQINSVIKYSWNTTNIIVDILFQCLMESLDPDE